MRPQSQNMQHYNIGVHSARVSFMLSPGINYFMGEMDKKKLHAFLIVWTGLSIRMTERVESWIKSAGEKCLALGFKDVGDKLVYHASQESEHDLMLVEDLDFLVRKWNEMYGQNLTTSEVTALAAPSNTSAYVKLHEDAINGQHPYTQVAIEYEIERISVHYGPRMVENLMCTLGADFDKGFTFLSHHVLLDQGHTKFNLDLMEKCFKSGANLPALVETGRNALQIYSGFLEECMSLNAKLFETEAWNSQLMI